MARTETFHCSVVTPEGAVLETDARFVAFPAHDGEIGILRDRAPLLCRLGIGRLRVEAPGAVHTLLVDGGFAEMVGNELTILTESTSTVEELDREVALEELAAARELEAGDQEAFERRQRSLDRARAKLRLLAAPPQ